MFLELPVKAAYIHPHDLLYSNAKLHDLNVGKSCKTEINLGYIHTYVRLTDCDWDVYDPLRSYTDCMTLPDMQPTDSNNVTYVASKQPAAVQKRGQILKSIDASYPQGHFTFIEHNDHGKGKCEMTAAILAHFGINLGAICFGASPKQNQVACSVAPLAARRLTYFRPPMWFMYKRASQSAP